MTECFACNADFDDKDGTYMFCYDCNNEAISIAYDRVVRETDGAILVAFGKSKFSTTAWLPKSVLEDWDENTALMPRWLAVEKELA